jgi:hypothetical protein
MRDPAYGGRGHIWTADPKGLPGEDRACSACGLQVKYKRGVPLYKAADLPDWSKVEPRCPFSPNRRAVAAGSRR